MKYHVLKFNCFTCFYVLFDYSIVVSYEHKFSVSKKSPEPDLKIQIIESHLCAITVSHNSAVGGLYFLLLYVMYVGTSATGMAATLGFHPTA